MSKYIAHLTPSNNDANVELSIITKYPVSSDSFFTVESHGKNRLKITYPVSTTDLPAFLSRNVKSPYILISESYYEYQKGYLVADQNGLIVSSKSNTPHNESNYLDNYHPSFS